MKRGSLVIISTILVIIGLILLVSSLSLTGNAISENIGKTTGSVLGLAFIIGGVVLFVVQTKIPEKKFHLKPLEDILKDAGTPGKAIFILDSSGAIDYKNRIKEVIKEYPGEVYVPDEIMKEMGRKFREKYKDKIKIIHSSEYSKYARSAKKRLEQTPKHQDYLDVNRMLKQGPSKLSPEKRTRLQRKVVKAMANLREEGKEPNERNLQEYIDKNWKVSKGDISLLATALSAARNRRKANILAEDTHIRDAVKSIRRKNPKLGQYLKYLGYRTYSEIA